MLNALWWLLAVEAIGLAAFPLAHYLLRRLPDRGYSVSKPLGILLVGYTSWILGLMHVLPSVRLSVTAILLLMASLSGWYAWRHRRELRDFVVRERRVIIASEVVFLTFFLGWTLFRSVDPAISHTEQPMDFAFLNASMETRAGPPEDPWHRGEPISYYYFGYWMMGSVAKLAAVPSSFAYNLSLALVPAMAASGIFGLVYGLVRSTSKRHRQAMMAGIGAAILLGAAANLEGVLEFMRANGMGSQNFWDWLRIDGLAGASATPAQSWTPTEFWWWFRATRVINTFQGANGIDYTIEEFPFFSFMLGDLHPHVMSIPFALLFLTMTWNFLRSPAFAWRQRDLRGYLSIGALGLTLGGLAFTNMWDLPTYAAIFLAIAALKAYKCRGGRFWGVVGSTVPIAGAVLLIAFVLYSPYFVAFRAGVGGIGPVATATRPVHLLIVWGLLFVAVIPFVLGAFLRTVRHADWLRPTIYAVLVVAVPFLVWAFLHLEEEGSTGEVQVRLFAMLPLALLTAVGVYAAIGQAREQPEGEPSDDVPEGEQPEEEPPEEGPLRGGALFAVTLAAIGLLLIMGPELLFVRDFFGSRMNTVFKLYYQAWLLLAVASGFAIYYWSTLRTAAGWKWALGTVWGVVFAVLLLGSFYYVPAAAASKAELSIGDATLDGLALVARDNTSEYEAIQHLRQHAPKDSAIVEAVGEWFDAGLISRSTGVPTVLNWPGHEIQWRGYGEGLTEREEDVARIYRTLDAREARNLLDKYDVDYVYVGPREVAEYGSEGMDKFRSFMEVDFVREGVTIYKLP